MRPVLKDPKTGVEATIIAGQIFEIAHKNQQIILNELGSVEELGTCFQPIHRKKSEVNICDV